MIREMLDGGCPAIGRDVEGKKAKASQNPPAEGPAAARPLKNTSTQMLPKTNGSYQHPKQCYISSQKQLAIEN